MNQIYILLGANLGNPTAQIAQASILLQDRVGRILTSSALYVSEGWGVKDQPLFYNQALVIETNHDKQTCLTLCQEIETELGRTRLVKWGARLIDIDIIYFNEEVYESEDLVIPHPLMQFRNFVLVPLCEIAADYIHPLLLQTNRQLLNNSEDELVVKKYT
ncbi:2-amino-4-hydroxy-6-hydroxymethyldihydropteridine diphosphokinase [Sphingobacterium tabacisoli]